MAPHGRGVAAVGPLKTACPPPWSPPLIKPAKLAIKPSSASGGRGKGGGLAERGENSSYRE